MSGANHYATYVLAMPSISPITYPVQLQTILHQSGNIIWPFYYLQGCSNIQNPLEQQPPTRSTSTQNDQNALPRQLQPIRLADRLIRRRSKKKRLRNYLKQLQSAKKNSESNIVNQLYSFFNNRQKSEEIIQKAIKKVLSQIDDLQKIKLIFYNTVRLINLKRGRKYVNRESILSYYTPSNFKKSIPDIEKKLAEVKILNLQEICSIFRLITAYFIRNISVPSILTSKRISEVARQQHLKRRRKILASVQCIKH